MTPQQLLKETQRAAGNANLTSWHDTLTEAGKEYKQMKEVRYEAVNMSSSRLYAL